MPTLEQRIQFAERYVTTKERTPYTLEGRDWVRTHLLTPAFGWRVWGNRDGPDGLCDTCMAGHARIIPDYDPALVKATNSRKHLATGCPGTHLEPIRITALNLHRREGKTFNTAGGVVIPELFLGRHSWVSFLTSAGDQTTQLFFENYQTPIMNNPALAEACQFKGKQIQVPDTESLFEFHDTSHRSITGRGRTLIVIDEARDIHARVAMAIIPSVKEARGMECPAGHLRTKGEEPVFDAKRTCFQCGLILRPWVGRIIMTSSSGVIEGGARDWFGEFIDAQQKAPDKGVHVHRSETASNPDTDQGAADMMDRVFGQLPSTRTYVQVEVHNQPVREGDDFLTPSDVDQVTDKALRNVQASTRAAIGFLDVSVSRELTSWVLVLDDPPEDPVEPYQVWDRLRVGRIDIWEPQKQERGIMDEEILLGHWDYWLPRFPGLKGIWVDTRGSIPWASRLVDACRSDRRGGWGRKVREFRGQLRERIEAYSVLESRILGQTLVLPPNPTLRSEIFAARRMVNTHNQMVVRESNRRVNHLDVVDALANAVYQVELDRQRHAPPMDGIRRLNRSESLGRLFRQRVRSIGGLDRDRVF